MGEIPLQKQGKSCFILKKIRVGLTNQLTLIVENMKMLTNTPSNFTTLVKIIFSIFIILFFASCETELEPISSAEQNLEEDIPLDVAKGGELYVILGEQNEIAYSVENMQEAVKYINNNKTNSSYLNRTIQASHRYIKFVPSTEAHLALLENIDLTNEEIVLSSYPLNYEIIQEGSFLEKDSPNAVKFAPLYTTVPINFSFPNVPYEILEDVYQPTDLETDLEITALVLNGEADELEVDVDGEPISAENLDEFINLPNIEMQQKGSKFTPHGYFKVWHTDVEDYVSVKYEKISIGRGIWWHYVNTDGNGHFVSNKSYRGTVSIRAKWRSDVGSIRRHWNEVIGIGVSDYLMQIKKSNNGRWYLTLLSDEHKWYKATTHNALVKYNAYMEAKGVTGVHGANVWALSGENDRGATTMMNKYTWSTTYNAILSSYLQWFAVDAFPVVTVINALYSSLYPDIFFKFSEGDTKSIDQLVFHEAGHFSHAVKAGGGYWGTVVDRELDNILNHGDPYDHGTVPNLWSGQLIALIEGWATFTEYATMRGYYPTDKDGNNINSNMEIFNMYTVPMSLQDDENDSWFLTGLIWDIFDNQSGEVNSRLLNGQTGLPVQNNTNGQIVDNLYLGVNDTWFGSVYNRLDNSVHTGFELKTALINATSSSHTVAINELFQSYGY